MAATVRNVDLTGVKEGGNFKPRRKPEGDYEAKVVKADDHQSRDKTKPMGWVLTIQVKGDNRATYPYYLSPDKNQAWKISAVCRAVGIRVPTGRVKFDPNKLVNRGLGVALADDEYEGRPKSIIDDVFPVSEIGPNANEGAPDDDEYEDEIDVDDDDTEEVDEVEEEEPPPAPKRRRKPAPEPEPEDDEEEEEEPEPTPPPRKRVRKVAPPPPEDDEEEEEEAPAPPPRKRVKRAAPPPPPADDDDNLDDLDTDDLD